MLGVAKEMNGAWSVICWSAVAQSCVAVGEFVSSAAKALKIVASSSGSQNPDGFRFASPGGWRLGRVNGRRRID
jgi:hypothetical protein